MEEKKWKLEFINKGREFQLPKFTMGSDMQEFLDTQKLKKKAELEFEEIEPRNKELPSYTQNYQEWENLRAMQFNLYVVHYYLKKIDPNVTQKQVDTMDRDIRAKMILDIFGKRKEEGFRKAPKK